MKQLTRQHQALLVFGWYLFYGEGLVSTGGYFGEIFFGVIWCEDVL
jgi:hypothetical protein